MNKQGDEKIGFIPSFENGEGQLMKGKGEKKNQSDAEGKTMRMR